MTPAPSRAPHQTQTGHLDCLIQALGTTVGLAEWLGITLPVLHGWSATGIPPQYHDRVIAFATSNGIAIDRELLAASYRAPTTPREIILALGGRNEVSNLLTASRNAVSNWYISGIPPKFHRRIVLGATERGVPGVTLDLLEATHHPQPARPARAKPTRCAACGRMVAVMGEPVRQAAAAT